MKKYKSIFTIILPYSVLLILYVYQKSIENAYKTLEFPNMNLYNILIGTILGVSLFFISTVEMETKIEKIIFLISTVVWMIVLAFVWLRIYTTLSPLVVALMNELYLIIAITIVHVLKAIKVLLKPKEHKSSTWIS